MAELTHFDDRGASRMVDVSAKPDDLAGRRGRRRRGPDGARRRSTLIRDRGLAKGDVLEVARLAGIMAAKRTGDLIPLCHPIGLDAVEVDFRVRGRPDACGSRRAVKVSGRTGVEMEALTAVSVAALTVYDMVQVASIAGW